MSKKTESNSSPFLAGQCPLSGIQLIEASAGTGKTYNIIRVFVRLLLEFAVSRTEKKKMDLDSKHSSPVSSILIVTFTRAATAELKDRIRELISFSLDYLNHKQSSTTTGDEGDPPIQIDDTLKAILDGYEPNLAMRTLDQALSDFDEASIYTIHSFAARILQKYSFESKISLDAQIGPDSPEWARKAALDFYRKHIVPLQNENLHQFFQKEKFHVDAFERIIQKTAAFNRISLPPEADYLMSTVPESFEEKEKQLNLCFSETKALWETHSRELYTLILKFKSQLNGNLLKKLDAQFQQMSRHLNRSAMTFLDKPVSSAQSDLDFFCISRLFKKDQYEEELANHSLVQSFRALKGAFDDLIYDYRIALLILEKKLITEGQQSLEKIKSMSNRIGYQDMVRSLRNALGDSKSGPALIGHIQNEFSAALIDEFQDTDPLQWEIFSTIFGSKSHPLFLIGDPKQSIYSFRGSDLNSYLRAKKLARDHWTLNLNFRSSQSLLDGINAIFMDRTKPVFLEGIPYTSVQSGHEKQEKLVHGDKESLPVQFHCMSESEKEQTKSHMLPEEILCLRQIQYLLQQGFIEDQNGGKRSVQNDDIAVLFRTHREADRMQKLLRTNSIASLIHSDKKVIETQEAFELYQILGAIYNPQNRVFLRRALTTTTMGFDLATIVDENFNENAIREFIRIELNRKHGFLPMMVEFIHSRVFQIQERLLRTSGGERKLTNLMHLIEIIHSRKLPGIGADLKWFRDELTSPDGDASEREIRLESDEKAVQLITAHVSKGLEFPIVIIPFPLKFHPNRMMLRSPEFFERFESDENQVTLWTSNWFDLEQRNNENTVESDNRNRLKHKTMEESIREEIRLLYVAMTRAKVLLQIYLPWRNRSKKAKPAGEELEDTRAMDRLIFDASDDASRTKSYAELLKERFSSNQSIEINVVLPDSLDERVNEASDSLFARKDPSIQLQGEKLPSTLALSQSGYSLTSFSRIISSGKSTMETDYDISFASEHIDSPFTLHSRNNELKSTFKEDLHHLPGGVGTGNLIHGILEDCDFTEVDALSEHVEKRWKQTSLEDRWKPVIEKNLKTLLRTEIVVEDLPPFCLSSVSEERRYSELPFQMKIEQRIWDQESFPETKDHLLRQTLKLRGLSNDRGFLNGFIDLVFEANGKYFILDWKSNRLGDSDESYTTRRIQEEMIHAGYTLQYYIYTAALDLHLRRTLPNYNYETHMGGALYLFVRGVNSESRGIFFHKPSRAAIKTIQGTWNPSSRTNQQANS